MEFDQDTSLFISSKTLVLDGMNGKDEFIINSKSTWNIVSDIPCWLSLSKTEGDAGKYSIIIEASDNLETTNRSCYLVFETTNLQQQTLYVSQNAKLFLHLKAEKYCYVGSGDTILSLNVEHNVDYDVTIPEMSQKWITPIHDNLAYKDPNSLINDSEKAILFLEIGENLSTEERSAEIIICNKKFSLSDTLYIRQGIGKNRYQDGEYIQLQESSIGEGVPLIIMGDGFTKQDLAFNGRYENVMKQAANYFFSIEPFNSYRKYFDVYMIVAESQESGVGNKLLINGNVDNKFGTTFGSGTEITCNAELCFEYALKIEDALKNKPITILMPLNSTKYAGTTYLYSNGNSIALCPMSEETPPNDFEGLIHHEAGGHGFGFLCDEYVYYKQEIPESRKENLREWQKLGFQMNLDFTDNASDILWKDFIGIEGYESVGTYEGGYEYQYGVWRSEENSCMNNNIPYFNVQSRWSIVSRIMRLAGFEEFNAKQFIDMDRRTIITDERMTYRHTISQKTLPPLGSPKWIK